MFKPHFTLALAALALTAGCSDEIVTTRRDAASARPAHTTAGTLGVTIFGADTSVPRGKYCTWNLGVSGGTPPYQFQWRGYSSSAITSEFTELMPNSFGLIIPIEVYVTDALGNSGYASVTPTTGSSSVPC